MLSMISCWCSPHILRFSCHHSHFKKRAPRAIEEIRKFAKNVMGTEDVRVDTLLNKFVWSKGVRHVPTRVRVRLHRYVNGGCIDTS